MPGYQRLDIVGHLGDDPEMKYTTAGTEVTTFSVAVNESWKGSDGAKQEHTEWFSCEAWGKLAVIINEYAAKGRLVLVEGTLRTSSWEDDTGTRRYKTRMRVNTFQLLDRGQDAPTVPSKAVKTSQGTAASSGRRNIPVAVGDDDTDDIPF